MDRAETGRGGESADAAGGERRLVYEVTVAAVPSECATSVRDPAHEDAAWHQRRGQVIELLENLGLGEVPSRSVAVIAA